MSKLKLLAATAVFSVAVVGPSFAQGFYGPNFTQEHYVVSGYDNFNGQRASESGSQNDSRLTTGETPGPVFPGYGYGYGAPGPGGYGLAGSFAMIPDGGAVVQPALPPYGYTRGSIAPLTPNFLFPGVSNF
ncbi:MAG TPA: hypothetical protein VNZ94_02160 [Xanthobacteraceae bacterium]|nr:hypothetical protein [Xanthobacteraceae bacterium]